ncbi:hypothetical protein [Streptomyces sp. NPDC051576]|uniref:hypothetical protein n=1 Tax=Streptomyces sp. NPDC051576 TaxID=3155803 RepID=UPI003445E6C3
MAKTGYGKRAVGDEVPHTDPDFAHLSPRDAEIATFVDHLEDGHAMGYKAIAAAHPRYGQQAVRVSLGRISLAGHLRWIKEHITVEDNSMRWVTRTYWSRIARSVEWWADFARERDGKDVSERYQSGLARTDEPMEPETSAAVEDRAAEEPSIAYLTLAELRAADRRMPLSDADCRALEPLAADWLSRGATPNDVIRALTDGLPPAVTNPGGLARKRLEDKLPPKKAKLRQKAARPARVTRVIMACGLCDADERTTEIVSGLCRECLAEIEAEGPVVVRGAVPETFLPGRRGGGVPGPRTEDLPEPSTESLPSRRTGTLPGADEVIDVTDRVDALRRAAGLR